MNGRAHSRLGVVALTLALATAGRSAADGPESVQLDYGAVREYADKYYSAYRDRYGFALRVQQMLKACDLEQLAVQIDGDVPKAAIFAAEQFAADRKSTPSDPATHEMSTAVALETQRLTEGYELAYLQAFKDAAKANSACVGVSKVYDTYLQAKGK
jgi:hypothetical protein